MMLRLVTSRRKYCAKKEVADIEGNQSTSIVDNGRNNRATK